MSKHLNYKQVGFDSKNQWKFRYSHGGALRQVRRGRKFRPLTTKDPIHLVLKANKRNLRRSLRTPLAHKIVTDTLKRYARMFQVKIEQVAIHHDHIHLLVRLSRRSLGLHFFRVVSGQIAQEFGKSGLVTDTPRASGVGARRAGEKRGGEKRGPEKVKLWLHRPFTRVVKGFKAYRVVRDYIQLNLKEAQGKISYKKERLKGLSSAEWKLLWSL